MWPKAEPEVTSPTQNLLCSQFEEIWSLSITIYETMVEGLGHLCGNKIMKPLVLPQLYQEDEGLVKETVKSVDL